MHSEEIGKAKIRIRMEDGESKAFS